MYEEGEFIHYPGGFHVKTTTKIGYKKRVQCMFLCNSLPRTCSLQPVESDCTAINADLSGARVRGCMHCSDMNTLHVYSLVYHWGGDRYKLTYCNKTLLFLCCRVFR